ncbi:MAG: hypothetical protein J5449_13655 [Oscillospiraceae bacterium]|nr:hypothetical protein [Oscillospiraceae bacterium]
MDDRFYMKLGKLHIEQSEKEKALNFGIEGKEGGGFFTLPLSARGVLRAAGAFGVTLAMRRIKKKLHLTDNRKKDAQRKQENALKRLDFGKKGGFGGGKRK